MFKEIVWFCAVLVLCSAQFEGEPCTDDAGKSGVCFLVGKCPPAIALIQKKRFPKICSFNKADPIVCCVSEAEPPVKPPVVPLINTDAVPSSGGGDDNTDRSGDCGPIPAATERKTGQKAFDKCIEYQAKYVYPCKRSMSLLGSYSRNNNCHHNADELIIGGQAASRDEFPHMVMVRYGFDERTKQYLCGGALISENFILTAAHCIAPTKQIDITHVIVGALTMKEGEIKKNRYEVKKIIGHPEYKPPQKYNDIALLETVRPIRLNQFLVPACLHVGDKVEDDKVLAAGWGQTVDKDASSVSDVLQKVIIEKFDLSECEAKYIPHRQLNRSIDPVTHLCYGHRKEAKDTCQGDSGGPLHIKSKRIHCMYVIVGVTSFGKDCGTPGEPGLYTRVAPFIPWIESIVWP